MFFLWKNIFSFFKGKNIFLQKIWNCPENIFSVFKNIFFIEKNWVEKKSGPLSRCRILPRIDFSHPWNDLVSLNKRKVFGKKKVTDIVMNIQDPVWPKIWQRYVDSAQGSKYVDFCTDLHVQDLGDFHNQTFLNFFPKIKSDGVESIEHHFVWIWLLAETPLRFLDM